MNSYEFHTIERFPFSKKKIKLFKYFDNEALRNRSERDGNRLENDIGKQYSDSRL